MWVISRHGRVKGQARLMEGLNPDTVWTWNAIGKRAGAWGLTDDAPESTRGFLLNQVITEFLPEDAGGTRHANADPVTGQAAWYDLRVRVEKADGPPETMPHPSALHRPPHMRPGPDILRYGQAAE